MGDCPSVVPSSVRTARQDMEGLRPARGCRDVPGSVRATVKRPACACPGHIHQAGRQVRLVIRGQGATRNRAVPVPRPQRVDQRRPSSQHDSGLPWCRPGGHQPHPALHLRRGSPGGPGRQQQRAHRGGVPAARHRRLPDLRPGQHRRGSRQRRIAVPLAAHICGSVPFRRCETVNYRRGAEQGGQAMAGQPGWSTRLGSFVVELPQDLVDRREH